MRSKKQEEEMKVKILFLSKLFLESNYSDIELSNITGISSSSVGRYLTSDLAKEVLGSDIYNEISKKRQENLYNTPKCRNTRNKCRYGNIGLYSREEYI